MLQDEFAHIEHVIDHHGGRNAYRQDGQVVAGVLNLTRVFGVPIMPPELERGWVDVPIKSLSGGRQKMVRIELRNSRKQDARILFSDYLHHVAELDASEDIQNRIMRKWFFNFLRFCTLKLEDALHLYMLAGFPAAQLGPIIPPAIKRETWMFVDSPFVEFLLFSELIRKV